tara:strand:- start:4219 stop:4425 length:207 start_codon:yes stop_codon:yes gene_type:complete
LSGKLALLVQSHKVGHDHQTATICGNHDHKKPEHLVGLAIEHDHKPCKLKPLSARQAKLLKKLLLVKG